MALWRPSEPGDITVPDYKRRLIRNPLDNLIRHESFFISDGGGRSGVRIEPVELRQAAQRLRTKCDAAPS